MIIQDLNKYNTPKYRLVARFTNSKVITQIVYATLAGDKIIAQADSKELAKYGLTTGLTSYPAAYATGLLLARRLLHQLNMQDTYKGNEKIDGNDYNVSNTPNPQRKPFTVILDIGLRKPTVGNRVFGVMKGATDGGLNVPHSVKKFPGFVKGETKKSNTYNAEVHRDRIFGVHIDAYMEHLKNEDENSFNKQFSKWSECLKKNGVESVEDLMEKVFEGIKKDYVKQKSDTKKYKPQFANDAKTEVKTKKGTYKRDVKLTKEQRDANLQSKIDTVKEQIRKFESS